jgi:Bax protein
MYKIISLFIIIVISCSSETESNHDSLKEDELETVNKSIPPQSKITVKDFLVVDSILDSYNFTMDYVRDNDTVPRIIVHDIRKSLSQVSHKIQQNDFIRVILAASLLVNEQILEERKKVESILQQDSLTDEENEYLNKLVKEYRSGEQKNLLDHIDVIPPSLIISQAILESGWGKSHFAYEGNSLFGEHAQVGSKNSITAESGKIALRTYNSVREAIKGYSKNLNRHAAYKKLRDKRKQMKENREPLNGYTLMLTLDHYSETGNRYIQLVKQVMDQHKLLGFDDSVLDFEPNIVIYIKE